SSTMGTCERSRTHQAGRPDSGGAVGLGLLLPLLSDEIALNVTLSGRMGVGGRRRRRGRCDQNPSELGGEPALDVVNERERCGYDDEGKSRGGNETADDGDRHRSPECFVAT